MRRATLAGIRQEYLKIAFDSLAEEDDEFYDMQQAIKQKQKYLDNNELSRF